MAANISGVGNRNTSLTISSAVAQAGPVNGSVPHTFKCSENFTKAQLVANREFGVLAPGLDFPLRRIKKKSTDINPSGCWCGHRSWVRGPAWCSWSTWDAPLSGAAGPVHQFPATGTGRPSPRSLHSRGTGMDGWKSQRTFDTAGCASIFTSRNPPTLQRRDKMWHFLHAPLAGTRRRAAGRGALRREGRWRLVTGSRGGGRQRQGVVFILLTGGVLLWVTGLCVTLQIRAEEFVSCEW